MLILKTPSTTLPLALADAKKHLRVDHTDDDTYITDLIWRACELMEDETNRDYRANVWELNLPYFYPSTITIPRGILATVNSVKYYDTADVQQTFTDYWLSLPTKIYGSIKAKTFFPTDVNYNRPDAVVINFTTSATVPQIAKHAICLAIGVWYENREDETEARLNTLGLGFDRLLAQLSITGVC